MTGHPRDMDVVIDFLSLLQRDKDGVASILAEAGCTERELSSLAHEFVDTVVKAASADCSKAGGSRVILECFAASGVRDEG